MTPILPRLALLLFTGILTGCLSQERPTLAPHTHIALYSEFPQEEVQLHQKLTQYFNLDCGNASKMTVSTPLAPRLPQDADYDIVLGNNVFGNTIYYHTDTLATVAQDLATVLNDFIQNYDLQFSQSINQAIPFRAHYLPTATLTDADQNAIKIGIDHHLPEQEKTQLVINMVVYLAQTLGADCLSAMPKTDDLQYSMRDCQCTDDLRQPKSYESSTRWLL